MKKKAQIYKKIKKTYLEQMSKIRHSKDAGFFKHSKMQ